MESKLSMFQPFSPGLLDPDRFTPRWEFQLDMLALDILLFGVVQHGRCRWGHGEIWRVGKIDTGFPMFFLIKSV